METDFQTVVKIENDFVERQFVNEHHAVCRDVFKLFLDAALFFEKRREFRREKRRSVKIVAVDKRFFDFRDSARFGHFRRRIDFRDFAVGRRHAVTHAGRGRDQIEIEFALQTFLNDFHVEQSEKAAAKTEAERGRAFRLVEKRSVVQAQFVHRVAQVFVLRRIDRVKSGENHRFDFLKTGKRLGDGSRGFGYRVADLHVGDGFDRSGQKADFADAEIVSIGVGRGRLTPIVSTRYSRPVLKKRIFVPFFIVPSMTRNRTITPR